MFLKRKIFLQIKDRDRRLAELDDDYNQLKSQSQHDDPDMDSHSNRVCHSWFYFDWNLLNRSILQEKQNYQQQIQVCITQIRNLVDLNMNSCQIANEHINDLQQELDKEHQEYDSLRSEYEKMVCI